MSLVSLFFNYLYWHYTRGTIELFKNLIGLVRFEWHYFSIRQMLRTWFSPWRRLGEDYGRRFNFEIFATALLANSLMRLLGFIIRSCVIALGLLAIAISVPIFIAAICFWLVLPPLIPLLLFLGFYMLIFASPK